MRIVVTFTLPYYTGNPDERMKIVGSHSRLGEWVATRAPAMTLHGKEDWRLELSLPAGGVFEYKYLLVDGATGHTVWQPGANMVVQLPSNLQTESERTLEVRDEWQGHPPAADISSPLNARMSLVSRMMARVAAADVQAEEAQATVAAVSWYAYLLLQAGAFSAEGVKPPPNNGFRAPLNGEVPASSSDKPDFVGK